MNEDNLRCKFCLNLFADPVFLHCGHSICKLCVDNLYSFKLLALNNNASPLKPTAQASATTTTSQQPEATAVAVQCPTCSQETKLDVNEGTSKLKISFDLKALVEEYSASQKKEETVTCENECSNKADIHCTACGFLCNSCYSSIHTSALLKKHLTQSVAVGAKQLQTVVRGNCKKHNKELELYCRTDDTLCCSLCYIFGEHKGHDCLPASDYFQECKEKVNKAKKELKEKLNVFNTTAQELEQTALKVQKNHAELEAKIKDAFQQLHKALSKREEELLAVSKKMQQDKQGLLSQQVKSLKTVAVASEQLLHETVTEDENDVIRLSLLHKTLTQRVASCSTALEGQMRRCVATVAKADIDCSSLLKAIADVGSVTSVLPPQKIMNVVVLRQENAVELSWDKNESATEYIIEIAAEERKEFTVAGTTKDCSIKLENLKPTKYTIRVSGRNEAGIGELSDMQEVQLASQRVLIKCWGAGGASGYCNYGNVGGAGGFIQAHYEMKYGEELKIVVGQGGRYHNGYCNEKISGGYPNGGNGNRANYNSGGGGGSSHVISSIHNCVILGAGGGGGACGGVHTQYGGGAGGGGGGGTYNGLVGTGGSGGCELNLGTNGTLGGGAGGAHSTSNGYLPGTSDFRGSGGKSGCNGASCNGAGGSAGTDENPGGGGGGGACSFKHIVENTQVIINATTHEPVNTKDADYGENAGAGAAKEKEAGKNGRVVIIDEQGKKYVFSSDATFKLQ